jgi:hypothetical protein
MILFSCIENDEMINPDYNTLEKDRSEEIDVSELDVTEFPIDVYQSEELKNSMIEFVGRIDLYYEKDMTFNDLKEALDPDNNLRDMTPEGETLLRQAYTYIVNDTSNNDMDGEPLVDAFIAAFASDNTINSKEITNITQSDLDTISKNLFGLGKDYDNNFDFKGGCKWYQVGCHLNWLVDTIAEWWNTDAPGDGDATNGDIVKGVASTLATIVGLILLL